MKQNLITDVVQAMLPFLNNAQTERLQEVLQHTLFGYEVTKIESEKEISEQNYVELFLSAKRIEGCSEKSLKYYKATIETYFATADVKGTSISSGTLIDYENRENRANMQPSVNSVWFAKMKNSIKHLYLNEEMLPIISSSILSTGFCGLQCSDVSFEYIASYISNMYFETHKDMLAHGATQEAVNNDDLTGIHIVIPDDKTLQSYHRITQPIYSQISKNICENQELIKIRDWLLPMLMNGQATIAD